MLLVVEDSGTRGCYVNRATRLPGAASAVAAGGAIGAAGMDEARRGPTTGVP